VKTTDPKLNAAFESQLSYDKYTDHTLSVGR